MKRIAIVFEFGTRNGGEHSLLAVLDWLNGASFEFIAIAPELGPLADALRLRGIRHIPWSPRTTDGTRQPPETICQSLACILSGCDADLVHANSLAMGRLTGALAERLPIPCVAHLRDILKLSRKAINDLNGNARLIAVSEATRAFHIAQGVAASKTEVIYNGVDCFRFQPRPSTGWLKRELHLPDDRMLAGTIGQISLRKGQEVLAEAAVLLADRQPQLHFVLIGERHSEKAESLVFEQRITQRFQDSHLADRLHCLGHRDDIPRLMNELDLLIHPAHQEPLGRVLLEAAASGLPIVATCVGGTPEILRDHQSAYLVPAGQPEALAAAVDDLCRHPAIRDCLAREARQTITTDFTIQEAGQTLTIVWRDLLQYSVESSIGAIAPCCRLL